MVHVELAHIQLKENDVTQAKIHLDNVLNSLAIADQDFVYLMEAQQLKNELESL